MRLLVCLFGVLLCAVDVFVLFVCMRVRLFVLLVRLLVCLFVLCVCAVCLHVLFVRAFVCLLGWFGCSFNDLNVLCSVCVSVCLLVVFVRMCVCLLVLFVCVV